MTAAAGQAWESAANLLCVRLDALGDVLMTTPAIRALKEGRPDRRVSLLTSPAGAGIARLVPEIDEVIVYEAPWMKATPPRAGIEAEQEMIGRLRAGAFDAAAIFTVYSQNPLPAAFLCYLAGIPRRLAHGHENPYQLLTDWVPDPEPARFVRHEVRRQLDLVAAVGARPEDERMSLAVPPAAAARARAKLAATGLDPSARFVVFHPGASAPSRRYPSEGFAQAARDLVALHECAVVFTGGAGEAELVREIQDGMDAPSFSLVGDLSLAEFAALLRLAPVLVSNNTGPVHIAAAVGTPVVDIYALTNPQHTPWLTRHRVLYHDVPCRYCYKSVCPQGHHDCLRLIAPAAVVAAAVELLDGAAPGAGASLPQIEIPAEATRTIETPVPAPEARP
ncbi:MAG TPA: lipopolysaccharide heptosyltransferase II [Vicinamibacterales bacterium]|nr:lipopolysaccharide heptosyltransferase II [Vicinamibacterales bacterium]